MLFNPKHRSGDDGVRGLPSLILQVTQLQKSMLCILFQFGNIIQNVVEQMPVHGHVQPFLVEDMADETDLAPQYEKRVERDRVDETVDIRFAVSQAPPHIHHQHTNCAIDVEYKNHWGQS